MSSARLYLTMPEYARLTGRYNEVDVVRVRTSPNDFKTAAQQKQLGEQLEQRFEDAQLSQSSSRPRSDIFASFSQAFNILIAILLLVAFILALIGGLGLTGAMGISVLERTREIGVLRAVGASHRSIRQVVVFEGLTVALISWIISALVSYPIGWTLAGAVIYTALGTPQLLSPQRAGWAYAAGSVLARAYLPRGGIRRARSPVPLTTRSAGAYTFPQTQAKDDLSRRGASLAHHTPAPI